jgi:hypothetical protein
MRQCEQIDTGQIMRAVGFAWVLAATTIHWANAQSSPKSLPDVTLDCYQSFATTVGLPENPLYDISIDGDNFDKPLVRYRLQVVDKLTLKIIRDPSRPTYRNEYGKNVSEMTRDFTNKHQIIGWREDSSTGVRLFTLNFEDLLFSIVDVSKAKLPTSKVILYLMKCRAS